MKTLMTCAALAALAAGPVLAQDAGPKAEEELFGSYTVGFSNEKTLILEDANSPSGGEQFRVLDENGVLLRRGMFVVVEDVIYFSDMEGEGACAITSSGRYSFQIQGRAMALTQRGEDCAPRTELLGALIPLEDLAGDDDDAEAASEDGADAAENGAETSADEG